MFSLLILEVRIRTSRLPKLFVFCLSRRFGFEGAVTGCHGHFLISQDLSLCLRGFSRYVTRNPKVDPDWSAGEPPTSRRRFSRSAAVEVGHTYLVYPPFKQSFGVCQSRVDMTKHTLDVSTICELETMDQPEVTW